MHLEVKSNDHVEKDGTNGYANYRRRNEGRKEIENWIFWEGC